MHSKYFPNQAIEMAPDPAIATVTEELEDKSQSLRKDLCYYEEELQIAQRIDLTVDLVLAAKRQLGFLRTIDSVPCLHNGPSVLQAIRRLDEMQQLPCQGLDLIRTC